eukprot:SAG22_NODE_7353_length_748_cov_1.263482_1_plen_97_part_00
MAAPRTETLSDMLPDLNTTLKQISRSKDDYRKDLAAQKAADALEERRLKARGSALASRAKHPREWCKPGTMPSGMGGGGGFEFGPYIRPTPIMLTP